LFVEMEKYYFEPVNTSTDIMEYWENIKFKITYLYQLARVVHSVPATKVRVERSSSAPKLVLSDLRNNLSPRSPIKILFVKQQRIHRIIIIYHMHF